MAVNIAGNSTNKKKKDPSKILTAGLDQVNKNIENLAPKPKAPASAPNQKTSEFPLKKLDQTSTAPAQYPSKAVPQYIQNKDKSMTAVIPGDAVYNDTIIQLSPEEWKVFNGGAGMNTPNVKRLRDVMAERQTYEQENFGAAGLPYKSNLSAPDVQGTGIQNKEQFQLQQQRRAVQQANADAELQPFITEQQNKPIEPLGNIQGAYDQAATFGATAGLGAAGTIAGGAAGASLASGASAATAAGVGLGALATGPAALAVGLAVGGGIIANSIKARSQNIKTAKQAAADSIKAMDAFITYANSGNYDKLQLIEAFETERRRIYAAENELNRRSKLDQAFWINSGAEELTKIEDWKRSQEQFMLADFYTAIRQPNPNAQNNAYYDAATWETKE